jgi:hypothetical protein
MGIQFNCTCGAGFKIKDKYGGKLVRCKKCKKVAQAPTLGEQFAANGAAVPKDSKLASGAVAPPSFFDTAIIQPETPDAAPDAHPSVQTLESYDSVAPSDSPPDTRPSVQTLESHDSVADSGTPAVPIDREAAEKPKRKRSRKSKSSKQPEEVEDDDLSALASATQPSRRRRGDKKRRRSHDRSTSRRSSADPLHAATEKDAPAPEAEASAPVATPSPVPPENELGEIAFASNKARARRANRRAVIYVDPNPQPNKAAEAAKAMKKGFKKFAILAAQKLYALAIVAKQATAHLLSGPDAGQINVIANIGPTRSAQAGMVAIGLFVTTIFGCRLLTPAASADFASALAETPIWTEIGLILLFPLLLILGFFLTAQWLGQKPELEEMAPEPAVDAEEAAESTDVEDVEEAEEAEEAKNSEASEDVQSAETSDDSQTDEPESDDVDQVQAESTAETSGSEIETVDSEVAEEPEEVEEADETNETNEANEAEDIEVEDASASALAIPSISRMNFKASVFVTGVALLPMVVQSLILMSLILAKAPADIALAVKLGTTCFVALIVYHALWGVLNLTQRVAFVATPLMLLFSYSIWLLLAHAATVAL